MIEAGMFAARPFCVVGILPVSGTGCCFANAAFLVSDGDDLCVHDFTSFLIVAVVSGNRKSRHFKINSEVTALSIAGIRVPEMKKAPSIYTVCYIKFIFNYSN